MPRRLIIVFFLSAWLVISGSESVIAAEWKTVKTKYLNLHYQRESDLKKFDKKIKSVKNPGSFSGFSGNYSGTGFTGKLAAKVDRLVEKVQLILDMRKSLTVNVRIYSNKTALHAEYFKIYKKKKKLRAWYIFEYNTVYLNADDLFSGMLAHELAHAIVDHYLAIRPPRATTEILARYVDEHLNKEAKVY